MNIKKTVIVLFLLLIGVLSATIVSANNAPALPNCCDMKIVDNENLITEEEYESVLASETYENWDTSEQFNFIFGPPGTYTKEQVQERIDQCQEKFAPIYEEYNKVVNSCCIDETGRADMELVCRDGWGTNTEKKSVPWIEWKKGCGFYYNEEQYDYTFNKVYSYGEEIQAPQWLSNIYQGLGSVSPKTANDQWTDESGSCESYRRGEHLPEDIRCFGPGCVAGSSAPKFYECRETKAYDSCWAPALYQGVLTRTMSVCYNSLNDMVRQGVVEPKFRSCANTGEECCPGYTKTKDNICCAEGQISYITESGPLCFDKDDFPRYDRVEIELKKTEMILNGDDKIPIILKFIGTDNNNQEVPMANFKVPIIFIRADNNAYIAGILGNTGFSIKKEEGTLQYTDNNGIYESYIYARSIGLGEDADKLNEVKMHVYTTASKDVDYQKDFTLTAPKVRMEKIFKNTATKAARPGAFNMYTIEFEDDANIIKRIRLNANGGTFKYNEKITSKSQIEIKTRDNTITFGWMPPEMTRRFRVDQIDLLRKNILQLQDKLKDHYVPDLEEELTGKITERLPLNIQKGLDMANKAEEIAEYADGALKTHEEMKADYYRMFEEDASFTEQITRGFLMTQSAYEITDGAISLTGDGSSSPKDIAKAQTLSALKESLRNELEILDAAKGKEYFKFFTLKANIKAGGTVFSESVKLTAQAPILFYEGS